MVTVSIHPKERCGDDDEDDDNDDNDYDDDDDDPLGRQGEYESTRCFSASIECDGKPAGELSAVIVQRPGPFHSACDAESADLQAIGWLLFGATGQPRHPAIHGNATVRNGGFLYIDSYSVAAEF